MEILWIMLCINWIDMKKDGIIIKATYTLIILQKYTVATESTIYAHHCICIQFIYTN